MAGEHNLPYFPFYPKDFASDGVVEGMSTKGVGAYILLLCKAWFETPAGTLPDDQALLAKWARLSDLDWSQISAEVLAAFKRDGVRLVQKRMVKEWKEAKNKHEKRISAGRLGGQAKAKQSSSNARAMLEQRSSSASGSISESVSSGIGVWGKGVDKLKLPAELEPIRTEIETWLEYKRERGERYKPRGLAALLKKFGDLGPDRSRVAINHSMASNYAGPFEPKGATQNGQPQHRITKAAREFDEPDIAPRVFRFGGTGEAMG